MLDLIISTDVLNQHFSNFHVHMTHLKILLEWRFCFSRSGRGASVYSSEVLSAEVEAAAPWEARVKECLYQLGSWRKQMAYSNWKFEELLIKDFSINMGPSRRKAARDSAGPLG